MTNATAGKWLHIEDTKLRAALAGVAMLVADGGGFANEGTSRDSAKCLGRGDDPAMHASLRALNEALVDIDNAMTPDSPLHRLMWQVKYALQQLLSEVIKAEHAPKGERLRGEGGKSRGIRPANIVRQVWMDETGQQLPPVERAVSNQDEINGAACALSDAAQNLLWAAENSDSLRKWSFPG